MDKSFNEEELSEIMKEIEAMEEEFKEETPSDTSVMSQLAHMDEESSIRPMGHAPKEVLAFEAPHAESTYNYEKTEKPSTSMSFKVHGDLNMDLAFDIGGKSVGITVSESGLVIKMDGGMTFTVPLAEKVNHKKVA